MMAPTERREEEPLFSATLSLSLSANSLALFLSLICPPSEDDGTDRVALLLHRHRPQLRQRAAQVALEPIE